MKQLKLIGTAIVAAGILFASPVFATTYVLHIGGMCSTKFVEGSGVRLANASGKTSIDAKIDTTQSMYSAASQIYWKLEQYCKGGNWCYIMNYSMGDLNTRAALSWWGSGQWNIAWVGAAAGAGGGSEIALGWLAEQFTCPVTGDIWVSTARNAFNHNDTDGKTIYHVGGYDGWWSTAWLLPGEDDGAVAYHSAGGCSSSGSYDNMCACNHFSGHSVAWSCGGYDKDHYAMKMKFITNMGW